MTILRLITDIEVSEVPSDETINAASELVQQFAHGVVASSALSSDDTSTYHHGHLHISNDDLSCKTCSRAAQDGRE